MSCATGWSHRPRRAAPAETLRTEVRRDESAGTPRTEWRKRAR
nr:MAG TPA: hypothetical protein [Caudoviricetes sp.]